MTRIDRINANLKAIKDALNDDWDCHSTPPPCLGTGRVGGRIAMPEPRKPSWPPRLDTMIDDPARQELQERKGRPVNMTEPDTILDRAKAIIYGQRQADYGNARENHERIAAIWSVVLGQPVSAEQVVLCMIGVKMARLANSPDHYDSWMDIAGYVGVKDKMTRSE